MVTLYVYVCIHSQYAILIIAIPITVSFNESVYNVNESDGIAQPVLVFSNSSATDITVEVIVMGGSAVGK